ncbi:MAG: metallopeptidase family protein [Alphaproteobacteria bacterium]|nr:metallopeptidase family protein [Alphaproteobacteria bacterium]
MRSPLPPSLDDIEALARRELASLPGEWQKLVGAVAILVEDFPDEEIEREMELESPFDLLGLYQGIDIGHEHSGGVVNDVNRILLYRRPLLDYWCETGEDLAHVVRHVLIHEIGHHFGLSDEDMDRIENESER